MRGKLWFLGGMAAGFVLGARAGRDRYDELVKATRKFRESPTVQEAAGVVREQTAKLYEGGKSKVTQKVANSRLAETRFGKRRTGASDTGAGAAGTGAETVDTDADAAGTVSNDAGTAGTDPGTVGTGTT